MPADIYKAEGNAEKNTWVHCGAMTHASAIAIGASGNVGMGTSGINTVDSGAQDDLGLKAMQKKHCGAPLGIIYTSANAIGASGIGASGISAFGIEANGHMVCGASGIREIIMPSTSIGIVPIPAQQPY
ncbi:hypothetical protein GGX14DRAFT_404569 [Mycena pura]|uniref:Uncharacterized protein n=1 Tax=Mycena pura TaxID=153505 RepID=A0AAD6UTH3_9AGAR|nr:hypothetical protein GGX14DRAFT_404569 [Mycena pura]